MNQEIIGSAGIYQVVFREHRSAVSDNGSLREGLQSNMVFDIGAFELLTRLKEMRV